MADTVRASSTSVLIARSISARSRIRDQGTTERISPPIMCGRPYSTPLPDISRRYWRPRRMASCSRRIWNTFASSWNSHVLSRKRVPFLRSEGTKAAPEHAFPQVAIAITGAIEEFFAAIVAGNTKCRRIQRQGSKSQGGWRIVGGDLGPYIDQVFVGATCADDRQHD